MMTKFKLSIDEGSETVYSGRFDGPLELGRQKNREQGPYTLTDFESIQRLVIASHTENNIGRQQLRIEPQGKSEVLLRNLSQHAAIALDFGSGLASFQTDESSIYPSGRSIAVSEVLGTGNFLPLIRSLEVMMDVFQSATSSSEFFSRAAQALVTLTELDVGRVLLYSQQNWATSAVETAPQLSKDEPSPVSHRMLAQVLQHKRVFWDDKSSSGRENRTIIAAPILDRCGDVIGALYGERDSESSSMGSISDAIAPREGFSELVALLVELLACGVASGLARLEQEQAVNSLREQFQQFMQKELADALEKRPDLLDPREEEATILFIDIRRFSAISEKLGVSKTFEWMKDMMSTLTESVTRHKGVVVDYVGDEIMAMWGAPMKQPDHAQLASQAALEMVSLLPRLNETWQSVLKEPIDVGIGINSGTVMAGNTGSRQKSKYGPLGHPVNLASRIQGVSKYLKTRLLISGSTYKLLKGRYPARRLCSVRVVNIDEPVDLYELMGDSNPLESLIERYENALSEFEQGNHRQSVATLSEILKDHEHDGPSMLLLSRAVNAMFEQSDNFDPIWQMPGK